MSLSCSCDYDYDADWYAWHINDFSVLSTVRRRRCKSCGKLIDLGENVLEFIRSRDSQTDIEVKIYGDNGEDVPLSSWYYCWSCGGIYLSLDQLGFCLELGEDIRKTLKEYQVEYAHESWKKSNAEFI